MACSTQSRRFRKQNTANEPPHNSLQQDAAAKQGKELEHVQIRSETIRNAIQQYASCIAEAVKDLYNDSIRDNQPGVFFAVTCASLPKRKFISSRSYASNPWFNGRPVLPPKPKQQNCLTPICCRCLTKQLARNWAVHAAPRLIRIASYSAADGIRTTPPTLVCEDTVGTPAAAHRTVFSPRLDPLCLVQKTEVVEGDIFHELTRGSRCVQCRLDDDGASRGKRDPWYPAVKGA